MLGTSKEMREERAARRGRCRKKREERRGEAEKGDGAEGNLLNVATKWNGN